MKEKAKEILLKLKEKNEFISNEIDSYAKLLASELDIPEDIAKNCVLDDLSNKYQKKLILLELFATDTLKENGLI